MLSDSRSQTIDVTTSRSTSPPTTLMRLRLWPGVVIVGVYWALVYAAASFMPGTFVQFMILFWGPILAGVAFLAWWLFASRLAWADRAMLLLACIVCGTISYLCWHKSFNWFGLIIYALPVVMTAWIGWLVISSLFDWPVRRAVLLIVFVLTWGYFALIRFEGVNGAMSATLAFRWTPTAEEKFLAGVTPIKNAPRRTNRPPPHLCYSQAIGRGSVEPTVMAGLSARRLKPIGKSIRRNWFGVIVLDRAGHHSR